MIALVIHEDAIEIVTVFEVAHRAIGDVDQRIHVFVAIRDGVTKHGDHFVRNAVDANTLSQRILPGEKFFLHGRSDHGDAGMSEVFLLAEKRTFAYIEGTNLFVGGINSVNAITGAAGAERDQALLVDFRRNAGKHGALGAKKIEIVACQTNLSSGLSASGLQGG